MGDTRDVHIVSADCIHDETGNALPLEVGPDLHAEGVDPVFCVDDNLWADWSKVHPRGRAPMWCDNSERSEHERGIHQDGADRVRWVRVVKLAGDG